MHIDRFECPGDMTDIPYSGTEEIPDAPQLHEEVPDLHDETYDGILPPELVSRIIKDTICLDAAMVGTFNRVSSSFRQLATPFHPSLHIEDSLAHDLAITDCQNKEISLQKLKAGKGSGIAIALKEWFQHRRNWMNAW